MPRGPRPSASTRPIGCRPPPTSWSRRSLTNGRAKHVGRLAVRHAGITSALHAVPVRPCTWYGRPGMVRRRAQPSPSGIRDLSVIPASRCSGVRFTCAVTRTSREPPGASVTDQGTAFGHSMTVRAPRIPDPGHEPSNYGSFGQQAWAAIRQSSSGVFIPPLLRSPAGFPGGDLRVGGWSAGAAPCGRPRPPPQLSPRSPGR